MFYEAFIWFEFWFPSDKIFTLSGDWMLYEMSWEMNSRRWHLSSATCLSALSAAAGRSQITGSQNNSCSDTIHSDL